MTDVADPRARLKALAVLTFGAAVIGLSPILVRLAETGPAAAGVWRLSVALPFLAVMSRPSGGVGRPSRWAVLAALAFALDLLFWNYGLIFTSVTNATVLPNLTPIVVTTIAWIFLRQRPRPLFLVALILAVGGAAMMALDRGGGPGDKPALGNALCAATAVWYALYMLAVAKGRETESASRLMFWSSVVGAPLLLIAALIAGEDLWPSTLGGLAACIGMGLTHVVGQGAIAWAMGRLPTPTASVVVLVQPVVAAWLAWLLFAEAIGPWQAAGAAVALAGVVMVQWVSRPASVRAP